MTDDDFTNNDHILARLSEPRRTRVLLARDLIAIELMRALPAIDDMMAEHPDLPGLTIEEHMRALIASFDELMRKHMKILAKMMAMNTEEG